MSACPFRNEENSIITDCLAIWQHEEGKRLTFASSFQNTTTLHCLHWYQVLTVESHNHDCMEGFYIWLKAHAHRGLFLRFSNLNTSLPVVMTAPLCKGQTKYLQSGFTEFTTEHDLRLPALTFSKKLSAPSDFKRSDSTVLCSMKSGWKTMLHSAGNIFMHALMQRLKLNETHSEVDIKWNKE